MKSTQFALAASVALIAAASAQSTSRNPDEALVTARSESVSHASSNSKAPSSASSDNKSNNKDDKPKSRDATDKKTAITSAVANAGKQIKDAKDANKDTKNAKQAKGNSPAPDANGASHQIALSGALLGAAAVLGAYI
ncbi:hypothetical protein LPJ66_007444 [Kickxella alabastrina]|uniref:Uncharacterized protein n=1 Tax=Kickxella alabastrina TaxID=61397 RepID=A0ACC1IH65_9FUNG|nr:hypothetical protein LPJ66_007444 [Kickxella alabastrina]